MNHLNKVHLSNFTSRLYELLEEKITLVRSLEIMSECCGKVSFEKKVSAEMLGFMREGSSFSACLRKSSFLNFDEIYISFVTFAEKTGNLIQTMDFLKRRCERQKENTERLMEVLVYPVFVILMTFISVIILFGLECTGKLKVITDLNGIDTGVFFQGILKALFFLFTFSVLAFVFIHKALGENRLKEAFLGINFLVSSGAVVSEAVGEAVKIVGPETKEGRFLAELKIKMEYGMSLSQVMNEKNAMLKSHLAEAFYYAEQTGETEKLFAGISEYLIKEQEKRKKICMTVIEPSFLTATGVFLLLIVINIFLPLMNSIYGGF